ncbi:Hypothetical predicted protein [Olea europaea subsp. europaea]|uniref:Transmembrane protein n=1 Tax=Olea europaea subsp. europaea TaxID=158383 RepID=A0A8S0T8G7_OLEEU|nr:Hypothetical predicted protein [Olea europaea subsp. europaea]
MEKNDVSEDLSDWEDLQLNNNNSIQNKGSNFAPNDHEDRTVSTPRNNEQVHEPQPFLSSGGDDGRKDGVERVERDVNQSKRLNLGVLNSGIFRISLKIRKFDCFKVGLWSVSGVVAVVLASLLHRRVLKWWKSMKMERKEHLLLLIKEKDQKINQLLLRIAQMNDIILARRKVPVLRVN